MASVASSERKRLRDRKAQRNQREKREAHAKALEDRVTFCERHHGEGGVQELLMTVENLRRENERLRTRQGHLRGLMASWGAEDGDTPFGSCAMTSSLRLGLTDGTSRATGTTTTVLENTATATSNSLETVDLVELPTPSTTQVVQNTVPAWSHVPINEYIHPPSPFPPSFPWLTNPDLVTACPPEPSPLDILHGTRRNFLANHIHRAIRQRAIRDSECLALGWLTYMFSKWRVSPNHATFARLAVFQHPVMIQLQRGHPPAFDMVIWPQMRANIIENRTKYDFAELTAYMSCCVKVRWPWGKDVLERDVDNNLQMSREFFDVFTHESGWGITSEFIEKYPALLKGMDVEDMRFQITLPEVGD